MVIYLECSCYFHNQAFTMWRKCLAPFDGYS
uniref:Uncharacterized protein n=1 Tax=Anguilla anguilla TaxID=7936 RepID=A0A0E9R162_ANGAN